MVEPGENILLQTQKYKNPSAFTLGSGFGGGPGQNRTADTRIFRSCQTVENYRLSADYAPQQNCRARFVSKNQYVEISCKKLSADCDSAAEFDQACFCCSHFFYAQEKLSTLLQSATFSQRSRALA